MGNDFISLFDVSRLLGIDLEATISLAKSNALPGCRRVARCWLTSHSALSNALAHGWKPQNIERRIVTAEARHA